MREKAKHERELSVRVKLSVREQTAKHKRELSM